MEKQIKNIVHGAVVTLADLVSYLPGQIVSKTLAQNDRCSLTLFAFDRDEEISSHVSKGDALVQVLDGTGRITIGDQVHRLAAGQAVVMPAGTPHAVYAEQPFKMLLSVLFAED